MNAERPSPDALLARVQAEESRAARGRLKVFLGACPGVGKTYAMLEAARAQRAEGRDVAVGVVETHQRAETEALLHGLEILPRQSVDYRGIRLPEFDLDAALARRPQLLLVDELAHTNAPGLRHAKRWQDVKELLDSGISVYTTLNIQHVESHNDLVAQITKVVVRETVPDAFILQADEVEVVDLPPDELLKRLAEGKVYLPAQSERARDNFFRPGNITALRELALRFVAEKVSQQAEVFRRAEPGLPTWATTERILVCVSPSPSSAQLVRKACRLAARARAEWIALYVELPATPRPGDKERVSQHLRLAERMGAEAVTVSGAHWTDEVLAFAHARNVTRIVVGKSAHSPWRVLIFGSRVDELVRRSGEIDVLVTRGDPDRPQRPASHPLPAASVPWPGYAAAVGVVALATLACLVLHAEVNFAPVNLIMVYLLGVLVTAYRWGLGPSLLASFLGVLAFDLSIVPPRWSFAVADTQYLFTFAAMLAVSVVISTLTAQTRAASERSRLHERRTDSLHALSRQLASTRGVEEILRVAVRHIAELFDCQVIALLPDDGGRLQVRDSMPPDLSLEAKELGVAQWVYDLGEMAGRGTDTLPSARLLYVPLLATHGSVGALGVDPADPTLLLIPEQLRLLEALAQQAALSLEVDRLGEQGQRQRLQIEAERLRSSILSSVSHDLRTPLAAITGAASALIDQGESLPADKRVDLLRAILEDAERLGEQVAKLLEMTRLEAGALQVHKDALPLEEPIGAACQRLERQLRGRAVEMHVPDDLPLVPADEVLIEEVFFNLLDNAVKYTPPETSIAISARRCGTAASSSLSLRAEGPGCAAPALVADEAKNSQARAPAPHLDERASGPPPQEAQVEVGAAREPPAVMTTPAVLVEVADRGPGLSPGEEEMIFEKFYRGHSATLMAGQARGASVGTGLGLSICRGIIAAHGGRIWAENRDGGGAAFRFTLPLSPPVVV